MGRSIHPRGWPCSVARGSDMTRVAQFLCVLSAIAVLGVSAEIGDEVENTVVMLSEAEMLSQDSTAFVNPSEDAESVITKKQEETNAKADQLMKGVADQVDEMKKSASDEAKTLRSKAAETQRLTKQAATDKIVKAQESAKKEESAAQEKVEAAKDEADATTKDAEAKVAKVEKAAAKEVQTAVAAAKSKYEKVKVTGEAKLKKLQEELDQATDDKKSAIAEMMAKVED